MKRIVYLGGKYQAESSLARSFHDAGADILFLTDESPFGTAYYYDLIHRGYNKFDLHMIYNDHLSNFLKSYRPDIVVHRLYQWDLLMHKEAPWVCKRLGIPYAILKMESTGEDDLHSTENYSYCDIFLYVHPCDAYLYGGPGHKYFYPYGVSRFERSMPEVEKIYNIGAFGYYRNFKHRVDNLDMFLEGIKEIGEKLHVYGTEDENNETCWKWYDGRFRDTLEVHPAYPYNQTAYVMNQHKVAVNFETLWNIDGALSHKLFQSIGCGIPVLTYSKHSVFEMLAKEAWNPIFVSEPQHITESIKFLLKDDKARMEIGFMGEQYIHEHYDWLKRFGEIMKREGVWK